MSNYGKIALPHRFDEAVAAEAFVDEESALALGDLLLLAADRLFDFQTRTGEVFGQILNRITSSPTVKDEPLDGFIDNVIQEAAQK